jgi:hypothetical protein
MRMHDTRAIPRNMILCLCAAVPAEDFLNFIENIGTSLTRSPQRMSETAGMNHTDFAHSSIMLVGSFVT